MSFWDSVSSGLKVASQKAGVMLENVAQFVAPPEGEKDSSGFGNLGKGAGTSASSTGGPSYGNMQANAARDVSNGIPIAAHVMGFVGGFDCHLTFPASPSFRRLGVLRPRPAGPMAWHNSRSTLVRTNFSHRISRRRPQSTLSSMRRNLRLTRSNKRRLCNLREAFSSNLLEV
jgi:hypothetical protein